MKSLLTYLITFASGAVLMLLLLHPGCNKSVDCSGCAGSVVIQHDTIRFAEVVHDVPVPFKVVSKIPKTGTAKSKSETSQFDEKSKIQHSALSENSGFGIPEYSPCDSIYYYSDTVGNTRSYVVIQDTISDNSFIGRSVLFKGFDLTNTVTKTIPAPKEKVKLYIGASVTINQRFMDRWGAGPNVLLTIPKIGAVGYYYDARNNAHTGSLMALIRFKK